MVETVIGDNNTAKTSASISDLAPANQQMIEAIRQAIEEKKKKAGHPSLNPLEASNLIIDDLEAHGALPEFKEVCRKNDAYFPQHVRAVFIANAKIVAASDAAVKIVVPEAPTLCAATRRVSF